MTHGARSERTPLLSDQSDEVATGPAVPLECKSGARHRIQRLGGDDPRPVPYRRIAVRKQKGILAVDSDPTKDADVIMTAAVVGYAYERLNAGKNCRFDFEVELNKDKTRNEEKFGGDADDHHRALLRINTALRKGGLGPDRVAQLGETPKYAEVAGPKGERRIIGGSGDRDLTDSERHHPGDPSGLAGELYELATGSRLGPDGKPDRALLGYQGRGAYTGFVDGRNGGQTSLMSTFRCGAARYSAAQAAPVWGSRWLPDVTTGLGPAIGTSHYTKIWGMIGTNGLQGDLKEQGMYFQDSDGGRGGLGLTTNDVVGYVHGMIQAIYDVTWRKAGTPYEIAVGKFTTKLASCMPCSLFMEATGFPASSSHLGRGESWCILHPTDPKLATTQDQARAQCNDQWAAYCKTIVASGIKCMEGQVTVDHVPSFDLLKSFGGRDQYAWGNLILDAVTVHNGECQRINSTLDGPARTPASTPAKAKTDDPPFSDQAPGTVVKPCPLGELQVTVTRADQGSIDELGLESSAKAKDLRTVAVNPAGLATFAKIPPAKYAVSLVWTDELGRRFLGPPEESVTVPESKTETTKLVLERADWIEIELVASNGQPLAGQDYTLVGSDHKERPGKTDGSGLGRHEGIPNGKFEVRLDADRQWQLSAVLK